MTKFLNSNGLTRLISIIKKALSTKQDTLTFDTTPTTNSTNPVTSGGVKTALDVKQDENFVVAFTTSSNVYSADKTFAATYAAYNAGKNVICTAPTEFGTSVGSVSLIAADIVVFTIPWANGTDSYIDVYYLYKGDSVDFVSKRVQKKLTFDQTPKAGSPNPVVSRGIKTALDRKQDTLVSGTNIKTFNGVSLLGSGNITKPTYNGSEVNYTGTTGNVVTNNTTLNVALKAIDDAIGNVETLLASI